MKYEPNPNSKRSTQKRLNKERPAILRFLFPDKIAHPKSIHGPGYGRFTNFVRGLKNTLSLTNHERVIKGRAKRMGISTEEYKRRYCL